MKITNIKMSFDLDHTFGISIKIQRLHGIFQRNHPPLKSKHSSKICADKSGVLEVVSIR
jgi:hypothetical protein